MANLVWAYGEIFLPEYDEPLPLLPVPDDAEGLLTMRWWSAWTLVKPPIIYIYIYICVRVYVYARVRMHAISI